jgi:hypothetical protein
MTRQTLFSMALLALLAGFLILWVVSLRLTDSSSPAAPCPLARGVRLGAAC